MTSLPPPALPIDTRHFVMVDACPQWELSPHLGMQFMEPLGTTDSSVEAAWDHNRQSWRDDVVAITRDLAPGLLRWGGCLSSYYRWKEAVGPRAKRRPFRNLLWGGIESNQIGTAEFVDFCRQVGADALLSVNFESDGRQNWAHPDGGGNRSAGPQEAAQWVRYCNDPSDALRRAHGIEVPLDVRWWQIGNETSYDAKGYDLETAARRTRAFARAMKEADPTIQLIGWGDSGWAPRMIERAGEHLDLVAFHHMFHPHPRDSPDPSPLDGTDYRRDWDATWDCLMNAWRIHERKVLWMRGQVAGSGKTLALTECHFDIAGRDRGDVMATWATGVAYARMANVHERNGDLLKIATMADFCGTRWQVNAVMIPTPRGKAYLMPVAHVMRLFGRHVGTHAVAVRQAPADLDISASRTPNDGDDRVFLHVVNTHRTRGRKIGFAIEGETVQSGRIWEIAADPTTEIIQSQPDIVRTVEKVLPNNLMWTVPPASVSAIELRLRTRKTTPKVL